MDNEKVYKEIQKYFKIQEFVSKKVYDKYRDDAWMFICPLLLHNLLVIRETLGKPITINNWHNGGKFSQRGLRSNLSAIFMSKFKRGRMYLSPHVMGKAVDFDVKGMGAEEVRMWLKANHKILPYKIRLEHKMNGKNINWVHLDVFNDLANNKVYEFNV